MRRISGNKLFVKALKEEGVEVVLINSNPATIMTDKEVAHKIYIEPLTIEAIEKVIEKERPDSLLAGMGGQTALNLAVELADAGIRLLDLAGLQGISPANGDIDDCIEDMAEACKGETFTESIYFISTLPVRYDGIFDFSTAVNDMILSIFGLAKHLDVDLLWHIEQKMKYNELREKMHGKKY